jgi:membrane-anchored protein YejM (alkaline phosphatase superfamily)
MKQNQSLVYEYVHALIHIKKPSFSREIWLDNDQWKRSSTRSPPSVIIIMLDAVSHLQAQRALPRTLAYLKSRGLFTFESHATVGDGTFANIVPLLFGQSANRLEFVDVNDSRYDLLAVQVHIDKRTKKKIYKRKRVHYPGPYDSYPFIAKNFSRLNYTTFFSEEWRESAFYNLKNGFRQAPTDFYLRPYWLSIYDTLSYNKFNGNSNPKPCYLDQLLHTLSLNWLKEFLRVHHRASSTYPTFGMIKLNEMSHDYLERLFWIDHDLRSFFENLIDEHLLDNTILIFCGDHGHRQHRIRLTRVGSFEVKLPFFSMLVPENFAREYPQAMKNLDANQHSKSIVFICLSCFMLNVIEY